MYVYIHVYLYIYVYTHNRVDTLPSTYTDVYNCTWTLCTRLENPEISHRNSRANQAAATRT